MGGGGVMLMISHLVTVVLATIFPQNLDSMNLADYEGDGEAAVT